MKKKEILFFCSGDDYNLRDLNTVNFFFKIKKEYNCNFIFREKNKYDLKNKKIFIAKKRFRLILWTLLNTLVNDLLIKKNTPIYLHKTLDRFCFHIRNKKLLFFVNIVKRTKSHKLIIYLASLILQKTNEFHYKSSQNEIFLLYDGVWSLEAFDIINLANKFGNKSILIPPNWDHPFKMYLIKPSLVLTWGERSKNFVKNNFNLNSNAIGSARLELAFKNTINKIKKKTYNKKYYKILFAGSIIPQEDILLLRKISDHINKKAYKIKIIYRPHPFGFSTISLSLFLKEKNNFRINNVYFDKHLLHNKHNDLKSYVSLFSEIDGLISSFSTLTLEAAIYKLPALCYGINNPNSLHYKLFNHEIQLKYLGHLNLLNKYSWPIKAYGETFFLDKFDKLVLEVTSANSYKRNIIIKKILNREVFHDSNSYYQRIKTQIEKI